MLPFFFFGSLNLNIWKSRYLTIAMYRILSPEILKMVPMSSWECLFRNGIPFSIIDLSYFLSFVFLFIFHLAVFLASLPPILCACTHKALLSWEGKCQNDIRGVWEYTYFAVHNHIGLSCNPQTASVGICAPSVDGFIQQSVSLSSHLLPFSAYLCGKINETVFYKSQRNMHSLGVWS